MSETTYWPTPHDYWLAHGCSHYTTLWLLCWIKGRLEEGFWITEVNESEDDGNLYYAARNPPRPYARDQYMREFPSTWGWKILRPEDATGEPVTD